MVRRTLVASNKSFESWADDFPDAAIVTAVLDRLVPIIGGLLPNENRKARSEHDGADKRPRKTRRG